MDIAIPGRDKKADYALVYSRDTGEIWNIDSRHNKLNKIDLPYEYLNYLYTDNGKILISSDNTVYGELDSFLTKNNEAFIWQVEGILKMTYDSNKGSLKTALINSFA